MNLLVLFMLLFGVGFSSNKAAPPQNCLSYQGKITLEGEISRKTFAGAPNFESIADGDQPETYWILHLAAPICVSGDESMPGGENAENNVSDIQLGLDEKQYAQYKDSLGKPVSVEGTLSHAFTGHHHTDILLNVKLIQ